MGRVGCREMGGGARSQGLAAGGGLREFLREMLQSRSTSALWAAEVLRLAENHRRPRSCEFPPRTAVSPV